MPRERPAPPPNPLYIPKDSSSQLLYRDIARVDDATPNGYLVRYPRLDEEDPSQVDEGALGIHYASFEVGLRFPLPEFAMEWLKHHEIVPSQLHPNGWAQLVGFTILCQQRDVPPSLLLFSCFYRLRRSGPDSQMYTLQRMSGLDLFSHLPNKINRYESRWFVMEVPSDWSAPLAWNHGDVPQGRFPPPSSVKRVYRRLVDELIAPGLANLPRLLTEENFTAAGWGVVSHATAPPSSPTSSFLRASHGWPNEEEDERGVPEPGFHSPSNSQEEDSPEGRLSLTALLAVALIYDNLLTPLVDFAEMAGLGDLREMRRIFRASGSENPQAVEEPEPAPVPAPAPPRHRSKRHDGASSSRAQHNVPPRVSPEAGAPSVGIPSVHQPREDVREAPSRSRRGHGSSSQFAPDMARVEEECRNPVVPNRKDRRRLQSERSLRSPPILPQPGEARHTMILGDLTKLHGRDFRVDPGVLETDSVSEPGIGARLVYSTILPRDERRLLGSNPEQARDEAERYLVQGIQGVIASNALDRAYKADMEAERAEWRNRRDAWKAETQDLNQQLRRADTLRRNAEKERDQARAQTAEVEKGTASLREQLREMELQRGSEEERFSNLRNTHEDLLQEHSLRLAELEMARKRIQEGTSEDRTAIRAEAVREYRLSADCHLRKGKYASGYLKYGFYLARAHLESQRSGESFPELVLTPEVEDHTEVDWRLYEPGSSMSPSSFLESQREDDMENLAGPWVPFRPYQGNEEGGCAPQDPGVAECVPGDPMEGVHHAPEAEEGEFHASTEASVSRRKSSKRSSRRSHSKD